ncbi:MAG TPA: hypothetical protein PKD26_08065 [Pyrinomonadaceae bacterium]|mgnify:CR=1 FL=1|nr:hypothetical protein [Pyrinomonadaceae bacterium]
MKETIFKLTARLLPVFALLACFQLTASAQESSAAKTARLLNETGYKLAKASETVWMVPFEGKAQKDIAVVASLSDDILVVFSVIAEKKNFKLSPELTMKLLRANSDYDRVKLGIDKDGDIFARIDISVRVMDLEDLKMNLEQIAAVADEIHAAVKPHLVKSK